jgi:hypothetical protein
MTAFVGLAAIGIVAVKGRKRRMPLFAKAKKGKSTYNPNK